jgi:CHAD domain-containing protein
MSQGGMDTDREAREAVITKQSSGGQSAAGGPYETAAGRLAGSLETALAELRQEPLEDRGIHQARRALKKARAALRLLRPAWGDERYRIENQALRDAGRCLSPSRDARAVLDGFEKLSRRLDADDALQPVFSRMHDRLERELRVARRMMRRPSDPLERCIDLLEAHRIRHRVAGSGTTKRIAADPDAPLDALRRLYRDARRALGRADRRRHAGAEDALHEWRKQVKYLLNAVEEMRPHLGPRADKLIERTDAIADDLGDEHDLAVLSERITSAAIAADADSIDPGMRALRRLIERRRRKLRRRALAMGRRVHGHKPARFLKRLLDGAPRTSPSLH